MAARATGVNVFDESKPMWRLFLVFLVPLIISNVLQSASQTFNSIFMGRMIGVHALAAVSAIFPIIFLLISFLIGIASGSTVLIGQAFGARDERTMKRVAGTTLSVSLVLGIAAGLVGFVWARPLLHLVGTPADILGDSAAYSRIIFMYLPIFFPYLVYTTFLRGTGDSKTPLYALLIGTILSIAFTPALIRGWFGLPQLGVEAAAWAGFIANAAAFAGLMIYLWATKHPLRFDREMARDLSPDWKLLGKVVKIGIPAGLQMIMVALAEIAVLSYVNRFGSSATAAYGAVNQIIGYVQFPAMSIGITASIFGAQCIGARREDKLSGVIHAGIALNYIIGIALISVCYIFSYPLLRWFITDGHTLQVAHGCLVLTLWSLVLWGNGALLSGVMRASGNVLWPTAINIFGIWAVEVPAAYILMHHLGLNGVWLGYPIAFGASLLLQTLYYKLVWKKLTHERLV